MRDIINLFPISNYLQTSYHTKEVIQSLDKLQEEIFKKERSPVDILNKDIPFPLSDSLIKLAGDNNVDLNNSVAADMFFSDLREEISKLPILTITLAISPTLELVKELNDWVIANVKGFAATDFVVDKSLIAGAIVEFKGKTRDHSARKLLSGVSTVDNADLRV